MALELELKAISDQRAEIIWVFDKTGAYDVTQNPTGWGDPNPELNETCLMVYAERVVDGSDNVVCQIITNQFVFDASAVNTEEKQFQILYDADGHYVITLLRIPVSEDGTTNLEGDDLEDGDYVYHESVLKKMVSGTLEPVDDYTELIGLEGVIQETCEKLFTKKAEVLYNKKYREFMDVRNANTEDIDHYQEVIDDIKFSIAGAVYQFQGNLKAAARETMVKIHEKYA
jgi:hypothetical protein